MPPHLTALWGIQFRFLFYTLTKVVQNLLPHKSLLWAGHFRTFSRGCLEPDLSEVLQWFLIRNGSRWACSQTWETLDYYEMDLVIIVSTIVWKVQSSPGISSRQCCPEQIVKRLVNLYPSLLFFSSPYKIMIVPGYRLSLKWKSLI